MLPGSKYLRAIVEAVPGVQALRERRYERHFSRAATLCFRGKFATFAEALASSPQSKPKSFDQAAVVADFEDRLSEVAAYDYPVMFWLRSILGPGSRVFDWGGHIGVHYHAYAKYLTYASDMRWCVCEVPTVVEAGRARSVRDRVEQLTFTTEPADADGAHILMASGSLQYIDSPSLPQLLASLKGPPQHLLLSKVPLHDGPAFVTLQNIRFGYAPYQVWNRKDFVRALEALGYEQVDSWPVPERIFELPFHPELSFGYSSGLYLKRR